MKLLNALERRLYALSKQRSRRHLYTWLENALDTYCTNDNDEIISIGAGGEIEQVLISSGRKFRSLDIDSARQPDIIASIEDIPAIESASLDVVVVMEVLEHVQRPLQAVSEIERVLKPGGIVIGSTPFMLGIHDQPFDFYRYTLHGLTWMFRDFRCLSIRERNGYFSALSVLILRRFAIGSARQRLIALCLSPLLVPLALVLELLDKLLPSLDATTGYFFIFRKSPNEAETSRDE